VTIDHAPPFIILYHHADNSYSVVANEWDTVQDKPYLFRTNPNNIQTPRVQNPGEADKNKVGKIARATSAAPTYFKPVNISTKEYSDGGMGNNNPAQLMLDDVIAMTGTANPAL
jgi:patatin-like phospholipase/acyl hydrolase